MTRGSGKLHRTRPQNPHRERQKYSLPRGSGSKKKQVYRERRLLGAAQCRQHGERNRRRMGSRQDLRPPASIWPNARQFLLPFVLCRRQCPCRLRRWLRWQGSGRFRFRQTGGAPKKQRNHAVAVIHHSDGGPLEAYVIVKEPDCLE